MWGLYMGNLLRKTLIEQSRNNATDLAYQLFADKELTPLLIRVDWVHLELDEP